MKILATTLLTLGICTNSYAQKKDEIIAVVGSKKITVEEFNKKYSEVKTATADNAPTKKQFLEELVRFEVGAQEAEKRNLEKDPQVQDRIRQELYKALLEKEIGSKVQNIQVSDSEMQEWYKNNPELRLSHILIELKPGATAEQRTEALKRANEIFDEVKKSKRPFEELVKLYSDDPLSKAIGGDVGWQSRMTIMPAVYSAALNTKIGDLRGLIETRFGFHIIKLTGRRSYENANKRSIRLAVFEIKRKQAFDEYFAKIKKQYNIQQNNSLVE